MSTTVTETLRVLGIDRMYPGIEWRPYYWGDDEAESAKPNFVFGDVEIRWYKYPGRGMSTNVSLSPAEWIAWFDRCLAAVRVQDSAR